MIFWHTNVLGRTIWFLANSMPSVVMVQENNQLKLILSLWNSYRVNFSSKYVENVAAFIQEKKKRNEMKRLE